MNKNRVLFKIKNHELYNDIKLIDLDVPVLFVCIDESKNRYLVLCVDPDDCYYLVVPITSDKLIQMLSGQVTMREPFETSDVVYSIITAPDYIDDNITEKSPKEIDDEDLPRSGARFNLGLHEDLNGYISNLKNNLKTNDSLKLSDKFIVNEHLDLPLKEHSIYNQLILSDLDCQKVNENGNESLKEYLIYSQLILCDLDYQKLNENCSESLKEYSIYNDLKFNAVSFQQINACVNSIKSMHNNDFLNADYELNDVVCYDESEDGNYYSVIDDNNMSVA